MSKPKKSRSVGVRIIKAHEAGVKKADTSTQVNEQEAFNGSDWIEPPAGMRGLDIMVSESSILPQCIRAYKNNIAGFGIGVRYVEDSVLLTQGLPISALCTKPVRWQMSISGTIITGQTESTNV